MEDDFNELDLLDYYSIMDRTSVILLNFSDVAEMASQCPVLAADAKELEEKLMAFYTKADEKFSEELDLNDSED